MKIAVKPKYLPSFLKSSATRKNYTATLSPLPHGHLSSNNSTTTKTPADYEHTLVAALKSCSSLSAPLLQGQRLHGHILKYGHDSNIFIRNSLISLYAKFGAMTDAESIFVSGSQSDRVSCNIMLAGYVKLGRLNDACQLFDKMPGKNNITFTTMIMGLAQNGFWYEAIQVFQEMRSLGLVPNEVTMSSLLSSYSHVSGVRNDIISACGQVMAFSEGQQFHGLTVKSGFDCYDFIQSTIIHFYAACHHINLARTQFELGSKNHLSSWNALISGLVRNGMMESARELFDKMPTRDVFSWSSMISGYSQTEQPDRAVQLFHEMLDSGIKPNEVTMVSMVSAVATLGRLQEGRWAHRYIINNSIPVNDNLSAAIIDMYAKCGSIKNALQVFNEVRNKVLTISPWNAIICGLAMNGHARLSLAIFSDLEKSRIEVNSITFIGVLSACCHAGLVEEGRRHFKSMKNVYNIEPSVKHYGCMVDLLGRAGRLEEADEVIKSMPMEADVVIWGTLLAASRNYGNVEMGELAAKSLSKADPSHGPARILLSSLYIDAGRLDDAAFVRREMKSQRLTRQLPLELLLFDKVYESFLDANALYGCADFVIADTEQWLINELLPVPLLPILRLPI
ncbi:Pentatricopeptide repeat-containing protein [Cynara cardunculus var. scolymus]|uniref:Pentatricopeptide repeat-containing protein n=1 Tax=Cynara cardunculus var. scolymus TaxID=59895 RepID=A0A124SGK6_CYNCS|nr:Pentatricopeptide repeat-containing protein [Cynara cardunculus var. scolymus]